MMINKELCLQMFHSYQWQHAKLKYTIFANLEIKTIFVSGEVAIWPEKKLRTTHHHQARFILLWDESVVKDDV